MPDYQVYKFRLITSAEERQETPENSINIEQTDLLFKLYIYRNKINQNLLNAPIENNNHTQFKIVLQSSNTNPFFLQNKLQYLITKFQTKILHDYPSIPCAYCSILMTKASAKWLPYNPEEQYTLTLVLSNIPIYTRENNRKAMQVAICNGCKKQKTHWYPPILTKILFEILNIPMVYRKHLLPVYMSCSLECAAGTRNHYMHYWHLESSIFITHNKWSLELYSKTIGVFLNINKPPEWFHQFLTVTSEWLEQNNHLIRKYVSNIKMTRLKPEDFILIPLPLARQSINYHGSSFNSHHSSLPNKISCPPDLIVPNDSFLQEIHNGDAHYNWLIAGKTNNNNNKPDLPILFKNPDLKALIFPDLFPRGQEHYEDIKQLLKLQPSVESYGKYIKLRMLCSDSWFHLYWYWPHWSYLSLKKKKLPKSTLPTIYLKS